MVERRGIGVERTELRQREVPGVSLRDRDQPIDIRIRKRLHQRRLDHGEDRRRRADADGE